MGMLHAAKSVFGCKRIREKRKEVKEKEEKESDPRQKLASELSSVAVAIAK